MTVSALVFDYASGIFSGFFFFKYGVVGLTTCLPMSIITYYHVLSELRACLTCYLASR